MQTRGKVEEAAAPDRATVQAAWMAAPGKAAGCNVGGT